MAELQTLRAEARAETGKNAARRVRNNGSVPAVLYGGQDAPQPLSIKEGEFTKHYFSGKLLSTLFMLEVGGEKTRVIPRGLEIDPVSDRPIHIDFLRLAEGRAHRTANSSAISRSGRIARSKEGWRVEHRPPHGRALLPGG